MNQRFKQREEARSLGFMIMLAVLTGVLGGVGAWAFRMLIGLVHNLLFLGEFVFHYDANTHTVASPWGWAVIFVPVVGALVVAWLVKNFAPEAKGHGVPEVIVFIRSIYGMEAAFDHLPGNYYTRHALGMLFESSLSSRSPKIRLS